MYAEGPCMNASQSQRRLKISFQLCTCPVGFQSKGSESNCECECDSLLSPYIDKCNSITGLIVRGSNIWITFVKNNSNSTSYLIYPYD